MDKDIIVDQEKIKNVIKEHKCPICNKRHAVTNTGGIGTGTVGPDMKLPKIERYVFICEKCGKHFEIPVSLYNKYK